MGAMVSGWTMTMTDDDGNEPVPAVVAVAVPVAVLVTDDVHTKMADLPAPCRAPLQSIKQSIKS